jgi:hypothetical protein
MTVISHQARPERRNRDASETASYFLMVCGIVPGIRQAFLERPVWNVRKQGFTGAQLGRRDESILPGNGTGP